MCKNLGPGVDISSKHCSQRVFVCLTHPLAHINIAQALSRPLSHIYDVTKCHDSPAFDAICKPICIISFLSDAGFVPAG